VETDKLSADMAQIKQRMNDDMDGIACFASTIEDQVDCIESTVREVAQAVMLLDEIIQHTTGLAQENAVVIKSIVKRVDNRLAALERRVQALERR